MQVVLVKFFVPNCEVLTGHRKKLLESQQNGELPNATKLLGSYAKMKAPVVILHLQYINKNFKYQFIRANFISEEI